MAKASRSIGQVLATVRMEFPDISISKIRFLESEGLLSPERAPSGYRKYADEDLDRLRYVLRMQRDHYLPLKVIKEHLEMMDRGLVPPTPETPTPTAPETIDSPTENQEQTQPPQPVRQPIRLSRTELIEQSGIAEAALLELERQLLIQPRRGSNFYGRDALTIAIVSRRLAVFGMDARHLRAVKLAAERELGMVEQAIAPYVRRSNQAREITAEVVQLVTHAHAALIRTALDR